MFGAGARGNHLEEGSLWFDSGVLAAKGALSAKVAILLEKHREVLGGHASPVQTAASPGGSASRPGPAHAFGGAGAPFLRDNDRVAAKRVEEVGSERNGSLCKRPLMKRWLRSASRRADWCRLFKEGRAM